MSQRYCYPVIHSISQVHLVCWSALWAGLQTGLHEATYCCCSRLTLTNPVRDTLGPGGAQPAARCNHRGRRRQPHGDHLRRGCAGRGPRPGPPRVGVLPVHRGILHRHGVDEPVRGAALRRHTGHHITGRSPCWSSQAESHDKLPTLCCRGT